MEEELQFTLHKKVYNLADVSEDKLDEVLDLSHIQG